MPFAPGEQVNLRFEGNPDTARLLAGLAEFTVANGGLVAKRDGGLVAVIQLPVAAPATVEYEFTDGENVKTGKLRVVRPEAPAAAPAAEPSSVRPRVYERGGR